MTRKKRMLIVSGVVAGIVVLVVGVVMVFPSGQLMYREGDLGFQKAPGKKISPEQALSLAQPYLAKCYRLRSVGHENSHAPWTQQPLRDYVFLEGNHYYVFRDNYPAIWINYKLHAVHVDAQRGTVRPPE